MLNGVINMKKYNAIIYSLLIVLFFSAALAAQNSGTTYATLSNGMKLVLKENHSSPMITSVVFVNAGARYEDAGTNGLTHFLEHLLFDGTESRSRIQLSETIEDYGGYINAFTRKDLTAYLVLMPKEHIGIGLDIQSDQLFNSIIPEEELAKERKVVIEEIRKSNDSPENLVDYFFNETVFDGTPYARTVLGTEDHISTIPREAIIDYYKKYYIPNNMIALIIGDFKTDEMIETYEQYFGIAQKGKLPKIDLVNFMITEGRRIERTSLPVKSYSIDLALPAPHYTDPDYYPYYMMVEYLSSGETSPLTANLQDKGLVSSIYASLETQKDFSMLRISAMTDSKENAEAVIWELERILSDPDLLTPSYQVFKGMIVSQKTQEIYLREKLHYYGFIIAPMMISTGYEFLETLIDSLEKMEPMRIRGTAEKYFANIKYVGTMVSPQEQQEQQINAVSSSDIRKLTFENGLDVIIKQNPDSRVFAVNIFGKNRAAMEPPGKDGITDFLNRMLDKGTQKYDKAIFSEKLANIGAQLTVVDNPYIPYDDRYTSQQYAFVKFETIDEFAAEGLDLLAEMMINPRLDTAEINTVKREMAAALGMSSASTYQTCRNSFYKLMYGDSHPFSKVPLGTQRTVMTITQENLTAYHKRFYAPNNMIMTICTNLDSEWVLQKLRETFGQMQSVPLGNIMITPPNNPNGVVTVNTPMEKEQVYIYLGYPTIGIDHPDYQALKVATEILSSRLGLQLREVQGLAYSVGSGLSSAPDFGWFLVTMGTGKENFQVARDGILSEISKMRTEPVSQTELRRAQNSIWGSSLTRQLSRINQAYYMALYHFMGVGYDYSERYIDQIRAVTIDDVLRVARQYYSTTDYYLATVGL
jgi:zinc protease